MENRGQAMAIVILMHMAVQLLWQRKRRLWVHPLLLARDEKGQFWNMYQDLRKHPPKFHKCTRMSVNSFDQLLQILTPHLLRQDTNWRDSITPTERLLVTLWYLAHGQTFAAMHLSYRMGTSTVHTIVHATCAAMWRVLKPIVLPPPTQDSWEDVAKLFWERCDFPNCLGAIDGKHIRIKKPPCSGSRYFNYKKYFSLVLLAVVDADYRFIYIDVGAYGSSADSAIFRGSSLLRRMQAGQLHLPPDRPWPGTNDPCYPFTFVGDEAFGLTRTLMRPYARRGLNQAKRVFNYRLSRARRMVECTFGILANKWRVLHSTIQLSPANATAVVQACCVLHNFVRDRDGLDFDEPTPVPLQQLHMPVPRSGVSALAMRDRMAEYFLTSGRVAWQDQASQE